MIIESSLNMTNEAIKIGNFDKKQTFHFCTLAFEDIKDIYEQGRIVECYLQKNNFLLLPRNIIKKTITEDGVERIICFYTSLIFMWDDVIDCNDKAKFENSVIRQLNKMLLTENKITSIGKFIGNNGTLTWAFNKRLSTSDFDAQYSYLITHKYKDGVYEYKIVSTSSFKKHFSLLGNLENTVLDMVFTGRCQNSYNNCYTFNNYKIKEALITDEKLILSNVKGVIDLEKCKYPTNYVLMINLLPEWINMKNKYNDYYYNMNLRIMSLVPEDKVRIEDNRVFYKNSMLCNGSDKVVLSKNEEKRYDIINAFLRNNNATEAANEYIASKEDMESVIRKFEQSRIEQEKQNLINERQEMINYIVMTRRQIAEREGRVAMLEYRTKEFLPFPDIILPKNPKTNRNCMDIESMLKMKNGKYIIEEGEFTNA